MSGGTLCPSAECPGGHCALVQNVRGDILHGGTIRPPTPARAQDIIRQKLEAYFACESATPGKCDESKNEVLKYFYPGMNDAVSILIALLPLVNLEYAFSFEELKQICFSRSHNKNRKEDTAMLLHKRRWTQHRYLDDAFTSVSINAVYSMPSILP